MFTFPYALTEWALARSLMDNPSIKEGTVARCSLGALGLITKSEPQTIIYEDGSKGEAYVGIQLTDEVSEPGASWSSRNPEVVGHISDFGGVPEFLVVYAFRYCLGRMSYAVSDMTDYLEEHWDELQPTTRELIHREIRELKDREAAVAEMDEEPTPYSGFLGMDCDRRRWLALLDLPT